MRLKNRILERVTDKELKEDLYRKLKADYPIFYTTHQRAVPNFGNVYEFNGTKIFVDPQGKQIEYVDHRILELYDDLDPNLNDMTDKLLSIPKNCAIRYLEDTLKQYDAEEVFEYLTNAKRLKQLHDLADFKEVERAFDKEKATYIRIYMFFYKGDFKSFGCTIQTAEAETTKMMLYDDSEDYSKAFDYFKNESPVEFLYLFDRLQSRGNVKLRNNEME